MRKNKIVVLLLLVAIMVLSATLVACVPVEEAHVCGHVCSTCGKCTDATCTNSVCADKCQGHTPAAHTKCPNCEGCLDASCTECDYTCECVISEEIALQRAVQAIKNDYKDITTIATSTDFSATRSINGYEADRTTKKTYAVSVVWTMEVVSGVEGAVTLKLDDENSVYTLSIDYPKNTGSTITLTAAITCGSANQTWTLENVSVPKIDTITVAEFLAKKEDDTIYAVQGWAVASGAGKSDDNEEITASFVIADSTGALFSYNKYYVEVGKQYVVYGTRSSNSGVPQIGTIGVRPVETEETFTEPAATELAASAIDLSALSKDTIGEYTGKYYKITGSFATKSGSYVNANYNGNQLLSLYMSDAMKKSAEAMVGKQVIVYGYVRGCSTGNYLTIQVSKIELDPNGGEDSGDDSGKDEDDTSAKEKYLASVVETPVAGTEYKLAMWQNSEGKVYYATGKMSGYYLGATTDVASAAVAKLEATTGGYFLKLGDKYVKIVGRDSSGNLSTSISLSDEGETVFTIGANHELILTATLDSKSGNFYLGSYGTNKTISASNVSYISDTTKIDDSQYVARLVVATATGEEAQKYRIFLSNNI